MKYKDDKQLGICGQQLSVKLEKGFSLIEILVVMVIFAILAVVGTQIVTVSIRNSNKSERLAEVRENVDYAFNIVSRELQNAESIDTSSSSNLNLVYIDADGNQRTISCTGGANGRLLLDGTRITSTDVEVQCSGTVFSWQDATATTPYSVTMSLTAYDPDQLGVEGAEIESTRRIVVRSF